MTKQIMHDPFAPWDQTAYALDQERNDVFNNLVAEAIPTAGGLRTKLEELVTSGNREALAVLEEAGVDDPRVPRTFYLANGQAAKIYYENGWHVAAVIDGQELIFTNPDRDTCMAQASAYADRNRAPRDLSQSEALHIARLAQGRKIKEALVEYLKCRLGDTDLSTPESDVRYRHVYDGAAYTVWRFAENSYVRNPQFERLLAEVATEKPLTFKLIADLYRAYLTQKPSSRPAPETPENEPVDLERLSDTEIAKLRQGALKERGRRVRQFDAAMGIR